MAVTYSVPSLLVVLAAVPFCQSRVGPVSRQHYSARRASAPIQTLRLGVSKRERTRCFSVEEPSRRSTLRNGLFGTMMMAYGSNNKYFGVAKADVAADSGVQIGIPVGNYLPASPVQGKYRFTPAKDSTPSIRGKVLKPYSYTLDLFPDWKALTVGVIQTGDFCQPKCDEPWTEVKFEGPGVGKAKVMMIPTFRLTNVEKPSMEDIGDVDELIQKVGPFITGDYYDGEDMPTQSRVVNEGGKTYYEYVIESPGAVNGPHNVAVVTTVPGPTDRDRYHAIMVIGNAQEKEWAGNSQKLLEVAKSFRLT